MFTIDSYQGSEGEVVLLTPAARGRVTPFLLDRRRWTVGLSRHKSLLVVLYHREQVDIWKSAYHREAEKPLLLEYFEHSLTQSMALADFDPSNYEETPTTPQPQDKEFLQKFGDEEFRKVEALPLTQYCLNILGGEPGDKNTQNMTTTEFSSPPPLFFYNRSNILSNMYRVPDGFWVPELRTTLSTVEHYFQGMKALLFEPKLGEGILTAGSGFEAKKRGWKVRIDKNIWDECRDEVMERGVYLKFQNQELKDYLISTEGQRLVEDSPKDRYWGECDGIGENRLGQILMRLRDSYTTSSSLQPASHTVPGSVPWLYSWINNLSPSLKDPNSRRHLQLSEEDEGRATHNTSVLGDPTEPVSDSDSDLPEAETRFGLTTTDRFVTRFTPTDETCGIATVEFYFGNVKQAEHMASELPKDGVRSVFVNCGAQD